MNNVTKIEIEIETKLYDRLANHTIGFENPSDVINRFTNFYEENCETAKRAEVDRKKPTIHFKPNNEIEFKNLLLETKQAWRAIIKNNGSVEIQKWNASKFTEKSSLQANLWSGILRNWKNNDIKAIILSIDQPSSELEILNKIIKENILNQKLSTRGLANIWLNKNSPDSLTKEFKSSKHFPENDWWFFTFDKTVMKKDGYINLLLSKPSDLSNFFLLTIPYSIFKSNIESLKVRKQNDKDVFDLYLSSKESNWLCTNSSPPLDLSTFLVK